MASHDIERRDSLIKRYGLPAAAALLTAVVILGSAMGWAHIGSKSAAQARTALATPTPGRATETVPGTVKYKDTAIRLEPIGEMGRAQVKVDEATVHEKARKYAPEPTNLVEPDPTYVLAYYNNDAVRNIEEDGKLSPLLEQNIPAWVYTYRLKEYFSLSAGPYNADATDTPKAMSKPHWANCRWIIVFSATNGEDLVEFENCDEVRRP